ncbi:MAG: ankyrin repeat domain-containing protein [Herminiimonas sp.]|nr:ankyrin repeat domain-containing protein [Herminiimonas sp.]
MTTYTKRGSNPVEVRHASELTRVRDRANAYIAENRSLIGPGVNPTTTEVLKLLQKNRADEETFQEVQLALSMLVRHPSEPIMPYIHAACSEKCERGIFTMVTVLLDGAIIDGNKHGPNGGTLLHAVAKGHPSGAQGVFQESSDPVPIRERMIAIANRVSKIDKQDNNKQTALHLACIQGNAPLIQLLEHYGANANLKDKIGRTAESYLDRGKMVLFNIA